MTKFGDSHGRKPDMLAFVISAERQAIRSSKNFALSQNRTGDLRISYTWYECDALPLSHEGACGIVERIARLLRR